MLLAFLSLLGGDGKMRSGRKKVLAFLEDFGSFGLRIDLFPLALTTMGKESCFLPFGAVKLLASQMRP
jgi:hypothetical protein